MSVDSRLAELGIVLPEVAVPLAAYVPAMTVGNLVFTSGQLPLVSGELAAQGKVGIGEELVSPDDAYGLARICALNALAVAKTQVGSLDRITQIVKLTGFVASHPDFTGQAGVVNGAS